jgi:hypothetical protein
MMKSSLLGLALMAAVTGSTSAADTRLYEMRTYYVAPGKFDALNARFRQLACRLLERHGMVNIGYWTPLEEQDGAGKKLIFVLAHASREAREASWKSFMADPEWQAGYRASEVDGKLVEKAEVQFFTATDYSPAVLGTGGTSPRAYELRIYTAAPGRLGALNARFRDHTLKLFARHGMTNVIYWNPAAGEPGADNNLTYLLAHASRPAATESFDQFRVDPDWVAARKASEEKAGGSLTAPDGVKSVFLRPLDYSPLQ